MPFAGAHVSVARGLVAVDGFALFFKVVFLLAAALTILMSVRYLDIEGARPASTYFLVLCATLGMMFMASGIDLITIFIGLETMAVSFYILVGLPQAEPAVERGGGQVLPARHLLARPAAVRHVAALRAVGHDQPAGDRDRGRRPRSATRWLVLAVILVVAGVGFKIAAVPFHMWAPDVYEGAPTPITAFLSVGSKAASFAMLLRIFVEGLPSLTADWRLLFYVLSVVTMTVGNIAALTQSNIKRMLAYSSIAHAGYLLIGVVAGTPRGVAAMLIYLFIYAFMQLGAFAVVVLMRRAGRRSATS